MRRLILKLFRRRNLERELEAELSFHRDMSATHNNPIPLGNATALTEEALDLWRFTRVENLWRDIVYATRGLWRNPALVVTAVVSLALGIGVNTTIFSLGMEFLFSAPSVSDPGSLASIRLGGNSHARHQVIDFLRESGVFQDVAGDNEETFINWNDGTQTRPLFSVVTSKNYFTALGVAMAFGRGYAGGDPTEIAVLRHEFWKKHFQGDPSIVGRGIRLNGKAYTVAGILPAGHRTMIGFGFSPDVYVPRYLDDTALAIYARLKPGMTLREAQAGLVLAAQRLDTAMPQRWKYANNPRITPVAGFARLQHESQMMTISLFFVLLLVIVGLVLLIACVNVASLLLARASARRREIAIRLSLGASRGRLMQQLLVESLLLSLLGAGCGLALAQFTASLLASIQLPLPIPIRLAIEPDWRVVSYAAFLAIFATLACGLLPAWQTVKDSFTSDLQRDSRLRLRRGLVIAQISVSVVVLTTGFLFLRNLLRANALSPGFDVRRTVRAEVHLPPEEYKATEKKLMFAEQALRALASLPGIEAAAAARIIPFTDNTVFGMDLTFPDTGQRMPARFNWNAVTPDFFKVMDIPVLQGRPFLDSDRGEMKVVIVNRTFAERYLAKRQPVGAMFQWGEDKTIYHVAGVVEGTRNLSIGEDDKPQLYQPLAQIRTDRTRLQFVLRSATPPATQLKAVREVLHRLDPNVGAEVATLYSSIGLAFLPSQVGAFLLGSIGGLGLLLACIGLYGVMVYSVARRTREIGLRMAIGATRGNISVLVARDAARVVCIGSLAGSAVSFVIMKPLAMFLVPGLSPIDPLSFLAVLAALGGTGLAAIWGPVRRAQAIDPMVSLRYD